MRFLFQPAQTQTPAQTDREIDAVPGAPLWVVLHGAFATAEQAYDLFRQEAAERSALLLAPEATRPCGAGYCWSFARDAAAIGQEIDRLETCYRIDPMRIALIGYSMGCTMGCWLLAQNPRRFGFFAALCMGSAFEPWDQDDGGIDLAGLREAAATTRLLLAVDRSDPAGTNAYFDQNLSRFQAAGLSVAVYRPNEGTHAVTARMKEMVLLELP